MERLLMCAVTVIFSAAVYAEDAPRYPTNETLYPLEGDITNSLINLTCRPYKDSEHLDCEILQVIFTKPNVEDVSSDADIDKLAQLLNKDICPARDDPRWDNISMDDPAFQDKLKEFIATEEFSATEVDLMKRWIQLCTEGDASKRSSISKQMIGWMIEFGNEESRKTCRMMFFPRSQRFTWNRSTSQWRSITESEGACGAVTVTSLSSEDRIWWTYASQIIVSDTSGKDLFPGMSCQELADTRPLIWAARGNAIKMNCQIIGESWTKKYSWERK